MRHALMGCLAAMTAMVFVHTANAELRVFKEGYQPANSGEASVWQDPDTGGWHVVLHSLYAPGGETIYNVVGTGGETIDELVINVPCWTGPDGECVPAGSPVIVRVLSSAPLGIETVHNIIQTGDAETILAEVDVNKDIGSIEVEAMGIINAGRDILGPVTATTTNNPGRGITVIEAERDILGDVRAPDGVLKFIHGWRQIGTPDNPVTIEANYKWMDVIGPDGVYANIDTNVSDGGGYLWQLSTDKFVGSIHTQGVGFLPLYGGMPGRIEVTEHFEGDVVFDGNFNNPKNWVRLPADGFEGSFVINAHNDSPPLWEVPFKFGADGDPDQIVIDGPGYSVTPDDIGGMIGLVPFELHDEACVPVNNASGTLDGVDGPLEVQLHHYGPVKIQGGQPVDIERRPADSQGAFDPMPSAAFGMSVISDAPHVLRVGPIGSTPVFEPGYEYRITVNDSLRCEVNSQPAVQWDDSYTITILESSSCPGDLNNDSVVGVVDLLEMLASWGQTTGPHPADLNDDGAVNVTDLLSLLANWGPCESGDDGSIISDPLP